MRQGPLKGPLAESFRSAVALVVCALVPYLMLSAAVLPLGPVISKSLGMSKLSLYLAMSFSTAAYAVGTVLAVQFAVHRPQRRMLGVYVVPFVVSSVLAAAAPDAGVFIGAFVVQGLCTSLMLIAAVPPLVTGWPPSKMPITGAVMNLCVFGAVAIGPTIGALFASHDSWRPLFWLVAVVAVLALVFSLLTFEDQPPQDKDAPLDIMAILLAVGGCAASFFGAGELEAAGAGPVSIAPLLIGVALVIGLVAHQYRAPNPLMPVKQIATSLPVMGIVVAMCVSSGAFGLMDLALTGLQKSSTPSHVALLFLPEFGAAVVTAALFAVLFRTRFTPVLALSGTVVLAGGGCFLALSQGETGWPIAVGTALLGIGVGASVSPALFIAGFSLKSAQIQRVFAFIELLRGVSAFLVAPVLVFLSIAVFPRHSGLASAEWICCGVAIVGGILGLVIFVGAGTGLQVPDLDKWEDGDPAWRSPQLVDRFRDTQQPTADYVSSDRRSDYDPGRMRMETVDQH